MTNSKITRTYRLVTTKGLSIIKTGDDIKDKTIRLKERTITTPRLLLRPFKATDLDDFHEYSKVEGVGEKAGWPHHENKKISKDILNIFLAEDNTFAIVHQDDNKVIGSVGFSPCVYEDDRFDALKKQDIGFVLSKDYWNRGLMTEAVRAVIDFAFERLKLDMISCAHFDFNHASKRVIEKCGFTFYDKHVYHSKALGKSFDETRYYLLKEN